MDSFFYNNQYYVRRPKKSRKQYKTVYDETMGQWRRVEIVPKLNPESSQRMRRLVPDFDQWEFERQISMMGEDDAE